MLYRLRQRSKDEGGFTLIELLVVILIIGILAAIAIPAFLNQKSKATDASAKTQVRTAETAMETYSTDHSGEYT
ncbi:MAG: type II secretion system protein, partial [Solirubrobacterales bacterium]